LSLLGVRRGSGTAEFFESPGFALIRALALAAVAFGLLRRREKLAAATNAMESGEREQSMADRAR